MRNGLKVGLISTFAALHVILYGLSFGLWRNWAIYLEPIEGVLLGPWAGFLTVLIGSVVGRVLRPTDFWMFGIVAEPLAVLVCGFLARGRWKPAALLYVGMLAAYFAHPFGRALPLWTILDIILSFILIYPTARWGHHLFEVDVKRRSMSLALIALVTTVTDSLTRVFLLIPVGLYALFGLPFEGVLGIFVAGAIHSYIEDILVVAVSLVVGAPLLTALRGLRGFKYPLT